MEEKKDMRQSDDLSAEIWNFHEAWQQRYYQHYGMRVYRVIEENPYQLADDIPGVGFKTAMRLRPRLESIQIRISYTKWFIIHCSRRRMKDIFISVSESTVKRASELLLGVEIQDIKTCDGSVH